MHTNKDLFLKYALLILSLQQGLLTVKFRRHEFKFNVESSKHIQQLIKIRFESW